MARNLGRAKPRRGTRRSAKASITPEDEDLIRRVIEHLPWAIVNRPPGLPPGPSPLEHMIEIAKYFWETGVAQDAEKPSSGWKCKQLALKTAKGCVPYLPPAVREA